MDMDYRPTTHELMWARYSTCSGNKRLWKELENYYHNLFGSFDKWVLTDSQMEQLGLFTPPIIDVDGKIAVRTSWLYWVEKDKVQKTGSEVLVVDLKLAPCGVSNKGYQVRCHSHWAYQEMHKEYHSDNDCYRCDVPWGQIFGTKSEARKRLKWSGTFCRWCWDDYISNNSCEYIFPITFGGKGKLVGACM